MSNYAVGCGDLSGSIAAVRNTRKRPQESMIEELEANPLVALETGLRSCTAYW